MSSLDASVWGRLESDKPKGDMLVARPSVVGGSSRLLAARDSSGLRHFLVRIDSEGESISDVEMRGLIIRTRHFVLSGSEQGWYIDLVCKDEDGHTAFDLLGGELGKALAAGGLAPGRAVVTVVARWKRFWSEVSAGKLSREAQIGLFGELWFFRTWLLEAVPAAEATAAWRGPLGARNDFERHKYSVEVKATTSLVRHVHVISSLEQLDPPENGHLYFFSLQLREEGGATNTLPLLVEGCRMKLKADAEAFAQFDATLARAGYADTHQGAYAELRLRIKSERLFPVNSEFPRLGVDRLKGGLPTGVGGVTYEIDLSPIEHVSLADSPETGRPILSA